MSVEEESQSNLFEDIADKAIYELPITERVRNFLRLEFLFSQVAYGADKTSEWDSRQCILSLIEIADLIGRVDIKGEVCKELDRHISLLESLQRLPEVDPDLLNAMLGKLRDSQNMVNQAAYHPGHALRHDELISSIRQRVSIAGGTCSFDLPAYHHWLSRSTSERKFQIGRWTHDLTHLRDAVALVLLVLRTGAPISQESTPDGFFSYSLNTQRPVQLVRILLPIGVSYFPEISGGRHRFSVRFLEQPHTYERPSQIKRLIEFECQICQ